jgi:hypothetical protein
LLTVGVDIWGQIFGVRTKTKIQYPPVLITPCEVISGHGVNQYR